MLPLLRALAGPPMLPWLQSAIAAWRPACRYAPRPRSPAVAGAKQATSPGHQVSPADSPVARAFPSRVGLPKPCAGSALLVRRAFPVLPWLVDARRSGHCRARQSSAQSGQGVRRPRGASAGAETEPLASERRSAPRSPERPCLHHSQRDLSITLAVLLREACGQGRIASL